ncbi:hypothetical protein D3C72_1296130 [compost metagenome]
MPWWARLTSPGRGLLVPPTSPAFETEWCGLRKGLTETRLPLGGSKPATEYSLVMSSASLKLSGGRMPGNRLASIVLPDPGGPTNMMLWPPAAAISSARLAWAWPRTSEKSGACSMLTAISSVRSTVTGG